MAAKEVKARKLVRVMQVGYWLSENPGDTISGEIISFGMADSKFGLAPFAEIAQEDSGEIIKVNTGKADLRIVNRLSVNAYVKITFTGTEQVKGRKIMKDVYVVETDQPAMGPDWFTTQGNVYKGSDKE